MKVKEAMHGPAEWVDEDTPICEIAERMAKDDIGAVPIGKDDRLVGMITDRDLAVRLVAKNLNSKTTKAKDIMTKGIVYCRTEESVEDAVHLMDQKKIRRLPVLNDKKRLVGMLSMGDVAHSAGLQIAGEMTRAVSDHHK